MVKGKGSGERFIWETGINLQDHMKLTPTTSLNQFILRVDLYVVVFDLRRGIFGASGYLADLCASPELQQKFLDCYNEMENYTVDV